MTSANLCLGQEELSVLDLKSLRGGASRCQELREEGEEGNRTRKAQNKGEGERGGV